MIRLISCCIVLAATTAWADAYKDWARDFIVIQERTEACIDAATTHAEAVACAGKATSECMGEIGKWPYPEPRDCRPEMNTWLAIHQREVMSTLQAAYAIDQRHYAYDGAIYAGNMGLFMDAEQAWASYASSLCFLQDQANAELSYVELRALTPDFCLERQYAERIFYLRSERNWLNHYRKPKGD
jgi:hypothetical protein